ncbi:MAG: pyrroloquinoline quinone-dependent dehydrogenase [Candidatus Acidiferrales bacterium]
MPISRLLSAFGALVFLLSASDAAQAQEARKSATDGWPAYGHDAGGTRYSPLAQINRDNVTNLKVAWTFHVDDLSDGNDGRKRSGLETTPIVVDDTLYLTSGYNRVFALDPETGKQKWVYDPMLDTTIPYGDGLINRGVATWLDSTRAKGKPCRRRIYESTLDARLIALDGATGEPCADFGNHGQVSLRDVARYRYAWYHMTSAPTVIDDVVVVGSAIDDNSRVDMASGVVRAFHARTGALVWNWEPLPPNTPDTASGDKAKAWKTGAGNAWSGIVADPERDLVFVPTGSASPDYYGGKRPGDDKWSNSIVALRGKTGEFVWGFQLVHHDLWDYDSAAPPLLATIQREDKSEPVVIIGNKTGFLFVLNRDTGVPVFPVEERAVPQSDVPGEATSPTQPYPSAPPALVPQKFDLNDAWGITPSDRDYCKQYMSGLRNEGIFTPPSLNGSLIIPGNIGGMNWSGSAWDPTSGLLFVNMNNIAAKVRVIPSDKFDADEDAHESEGQFTGQWGSGYGMFRTFILSKASRLPCTAPPWGTLAAVDIAKGTIAWQVPLGSLAPTIPTVPAGDVSLGGPIVTAGGLVFIGGTVRDPEFRAFDVATGKELWKTKLPAVAAAVPMTYQLKPGGKQFVVVAAGGHGNVGEEKLGDSIVAFTLP